jgi:hypothetical protein
MIPAYQPTYIVPLLLWVICVILGVSLITFSTNISKFIYEIFIISWPINASSKNRENFKNVDTKQRGLWVTRSIVIFGILLLCFPLIWLLLLLLFMLQMSFL